MMDAGKLLIIFGVFLALGIFWAFNATKNPNDEHDRDEV